MDRYGPDRTLDAIAGASATRSRVINVPVRLRSADAEYDVFLPQYEVELHGEQVPPISYRGRSFVFMHKTAVGSYLHSDEQEAYVFADSGPAF